MREKSKALAVFLGSFLVLALIATLMPKNYASLVSNLILASVAVTSLWIAGQKFLSKRALNFEVDISKEYEDDSESPRAKIEVYNKGRSPFSVEYVEYKALTVNDKEDFFEFKTFQKAPNKAVEIGSPYESILGEGENIIGFNFGVVVVKTPEGKYGERDRIFGTGNAWWNPRSLNLSEDEAETLHHSWMKYSESEKLASFVFDKEKLEEKSTDEFIEYMQEDLSEDYYPSDF